MSQKADEVFRDLRRRILADELGVGDRLPPERELAQQYDTNRNTLREAIRRLEQSRLVTVRQGRGVTVCDYRQTAGLDILTAFLEHGTDMGEKLGIFAELMGARVQVLDYAMQLAVDRADPSDFRRLERITHRLLDAFEVGDRLALARDYGEWLSALVDAAHSLPARWIANPFLELNRNLMERFPNLWVLDPGFPEYLRGCLTALLEGDTDGWKHVTEAYYGRVDAVILQALRQLVPRPRETPVSESAEDR